MNSISFLDKSIIAYRGVYNNITIYENTLESIIYSLKNGLSAFVDVVLTKDEKLVVFSDLDATRLLKLKDEISTLTFSDLKYISPYNINTLDEILENVKDKPLVINVKENNKVIKKKLLNIVKKYKDNILIISKDYDLIKHFKNKKYCVGLIIDKSNKEYLNKELDIDSMFIKYDLIDETKIKFLKEKYYLVGYTIDNRDDAKKYIKIYNNLVIDNIEEVFR